MTDQPDIEQLAKGYLDLWQEHLTSLSQDPAIAETMAKTMALMNSGAATFANSMAEAAKSAPGCDNSNQDSGSDHGDFQSPPADPSPRDRTPAAALSPGDATAQFDQLLERIAQLEERVAQLEQFPKPARDSKVRRRK